MIYVALTDYSTEAPPRKIFARGRDKRVGVFAEETQVDVTLDLEAAGIVEYPDGSIIPTALSAAVPLFKGATDVALVAALS